MRSPQLLHANLGPGQLVGVQDCFNEVLGVDDFRLCIAHHEDVLVLLFVVNHLLGCARRASVLLLEQRAPSDQDLAARLFFEALLVGAPWADYQADEVGCSAHWERNLDAERVEL